MAQTYQIDGAAVSRINQSPWSDEPVETSLNLIAVHPARRRLIWLADAEDMTEWLVLQGKIGSVVSVTTPPPDDLNGDYVTYYDAVVESVLPARHESLIMRGVEIRFLVKV